MHKAIHDNSPYMKQFDAGAKTVLKHFAINWKRNLYRRRNTEILLSDTTNHGESALIAHDNGIASPMDVYGHSTIINHPALYDALLQLSKKDSALFILRYAHDYSVLELAEMFTMPTRTIYKRLSVAREMITQYVQKHNRPNE